MIKLFILELIKPRSRYNKSWLSLTVNIENQPLAILRNKENIFTAILQLIMARCVYQTVCVGLLTVEPRGSDVSKPHPLYVTTKSQNRRKTYHFNFPFSKFHCCDIVIVLLVEYLWTL